MTDARTPAPAGGVIPPMVTPMLPDGTPDLGSLGSLIDHLIDAGCTGLLVLGSCGENGALSRDERLAVAEHAVRRVAGRVHLMVGVPALGLRDAVHDAADYAALGADSVLVPAPFVFPHSAAELARYFTTVADAADGTPVLAYNIPGRVNVNLDAELLAELADAGVIVGVKDSSGNIEAQRQLALRTAELPGFRRYTGSEMAIDGLLLGGFHGCVPGLANVFAPWHVTLADRAGAGDWPGAAAVQARITSLFRLYQHPLDEGSFSAAVVGSLKEALVQRKVIEHATTAYPFIQVNESMRAHVAQVLADTDRVPS